MYDVCIMRLSIYVLWGQVDVAVQSCECSVILINFLKMQQKKNSYNLKSAVRSSAGEEAAYIFQDAE